MDMSEEIAALQARVEVLSGALQEVCRALPDDTAAYVMHALSGRVASAERALETPDVDEARAAELAGLVDALGRNRN
jgi:hypothetical protein